MHSLFFIVKEYFVVRTHHNFFLLVDIGYRTTIINTTQKVRNLPNVAKLVKKQDVSSLDHLESLYTVHGTEYRGSPHLL